MGKLDILSLIFTADKVWITELTLIHKNIWVSSLLAYISLSDFKHYDITDKNHNVSSNT